MSWRSWLNVHSTAGACVLGVAAVLLLWSLIGSRCSGRLTEVRTFGVWYYDVEAGAYFEDEGRKLTPFLNAAGHECVRVHLLSCGKCTQDNRYVGWYEKFSPALAAQVEAHGRGRMYREISDRIGVLVSADAETWIEGSSADGKKLVMDALAKCPGGAKRCLPQDCPGCSVPVPR